MLFSRTAGGNEVTVAANLSAEEVAFDLPFEGSRREFFTGKEYTGGTRTVLPAMAVAGLRTRQEIKVADMRRGCAETAPGTRREPDRTRRE